MIVLGFDYGRKRIGVAVGQSITQTASPVLTLQVHKGKLPWQEIAKLIKLWHPEAMVVGFPLNMDGTPQEITQETEQFAEGLREHFKLPVYGADERLTTVAVRERLFACGGYKALQAGNIDGFAAQMIIEDWFKAQE